MVTLGKALSHYRILERLGAGGMGGVYRAHDKRLGRDVAVKVLPADAANHPTPRARFEQSEGTFQVELRGSNQKSRRMVMRRINILPLLLLVCFASAMQAQAPAPKADPALKKLHFLVGHWTYEGEYKPGPLGPGGQITGEYNGQMILGGFFFQGRGTEKGPMGMSYLEIEAYDPVNKNFASNMYLSDGSRISAVLTVNGNTFTWEGKWLGAGKQYAFKETHVTASDLTSATDNGEISVDGKTWTPFWEEKWTKAKPAPKK